MGISIQHQQSTIFDPIKTCTVPSTVMLNDYSQLMHIYFTTILFIRMEAIEEKNHHEIIKYPWKKKSRQKIRFWVSIL